MILFSVKIKETIIKKSDLLVSVIITKYEIAISKILNLLPIADIINLCLFGKTNTEIIKYCINIKFHKFTIHYF